jgi:amino acid transporter
MVGRDAAEPDIVSRALARNRLGVPSVVFFGIAGAAPLTVILGAVTTIYAVVGNIAVPISYIFAACILSIFTVGFVAMSRHIVNSGAFYSYISQGMGRVIGVGAAFVALPAYSVMQIGLFGLFGVVARSIFAAFGLSVDWFFCALFAWLVVSILGLLWVDLSGKVLAVLLVAEISIVLVYDVIMMLHPAGGHLSFTTLNPARMVSSEAAAMLVLAISGFVGFEATVVLSEEAKDPKRTIARATHWAVLIPGVLIALSAWAMSVAAGPDTIVAQAKHDTTDLVFNLVQSHAPAILVQIGGLLFLTSVFAALLAFHAAVARYQFALGREGVLPSIWGRTHPRTGAPLMGSVTQSALSVIVLVLYYAFKQDPLVHLFAWLTVAGGLGVLILMWAASAAVVAFFIRNRGLVNFWRGQFAPTLAFLLLTGVLAATVIGLGDLLGVPKDSIFQWLFATAYAVFAVIGFIWAFVMRGAKPEAYANIGRGTQGHLPDIPTIASIQRGLHADSVAAVTSAPPAPPNFAVPPDLNSLMKGNR